LTRQMDRKERSSAPVGDEVVKTKSAGRGTRNVVARAWARTRNAVSEKVAVSAGRSRVRGEEGSSTSGRNRRNDFAADEQGVLSAGSSSTAVVHYTSQTSVSPPRTQVDNERSRRNGVCL
jgi:hypothetical protein